jgi:hypothetical protein
MAKKNAPIEELAQEELVVPAVEVAEEAPVVEEAVVNPLANGYPSRDFYSAIPGVSEGKAAAQIPVEEVIPSEDGGQEEA